MSRFIIYGAGNAGERAIRKCRQIYGDEVICVCDSFKVGDFCGINIIKPEEMPKDEIVILANNLPKSVKKMYERVRLLPIRQLFWFLDLDDETVEKKDFLTDECMEIRNWGDCLLADLEVHIADNCNLNCKGCAHFSPLFDQVGVDFNGCIEDIRKVRNKVSNIARLDLLGGEPLLNPELSEYVKTVRTLLPDTRISIFTNGLLIPTLSDDTLKTISTQQVAFMISEYPETSKMLIRIKGILQENKIRYLVTPIRNQFNIPISITEKSRYPHRCISDGCVSISDGKIARCPTLLYLHKFNETFSKSLPEDGILDLDETISGEAFLKKMEERVPLCGYCIEKSIVWELCSRPVQLEDFAVYE